MTHRSWVVSRTAIFLAGLGILLMGASTPAAAHPLSTSAVLLDVDHDQVGAIIELPLDELSVAWNQVLSSTTVVRPDTLSALRAYVGDHVTASDATGQAWTTVITGGRIEQIDGIDNLVLTATLTPASGSVGEFVLHDDAVIDRLVSHRVFVSGRYGHSGSYTTLAMLSWQTTSVPVRPATPQPGQGFLAAVRLGIHHIASGSDHLLFLIMLLLPAPLVAFGRRWRRAPGEGLAEVRRSSLRVVHVVTAFAIGHSCTLALGALGWVNVPTRVVESGIAVSVLVSAVHSIRPLVRRGEVLIAGGFGLLHGLAFAALLSGLELTRENLITTLLGFNVGIELTQLLVVALVMPSLILLSSTAVYPALRIGLATVGAGLACGWLAERVGLIGTDPVHGVADLLVDHPLALALGLFALAVAVRGWERWRPRPPAGPIKARPVAELSAGPWPLAGAARRGGRR